MGYLCVVPKWGLCHCYSTIAVTYPCPLLLPKGGDLTHFPTLVQILYQIPLDESGDAGHWLGLPQVFVESYLLKHPHGFCQSNLHLDVVSPRNTYILGIRHGVFLPQRPYQDIMVILHVWNGCLVSTNDVKCPCQIVIIFWSWFSSQLIWFGQNTHFYWIPYYLYCWLFVSSDIIKILRPD